MKKNSLSCSMPNFMIVGAPKSGTTSLYSYLNMHPDIFLSKQKELHYWSHEDLKLFTNGPGDSEAISKIISSLEDYKRQFSNNSGESMLGDISPSYLYFHKTVIERLKSNYQNRNLKIIISLRDPVKRAYSQYLHQKKAMLETLPFYDALKEEEVRFKNGYGDFWRYAEHSLYYEGCKSYIDTFGEKNVKIILFEDFIEDPQTVVKTIFDFLSLDGSYVPTNLNKVYNQGEVYKENWLTKSLLKPSKMKLYLNRVLGSKILERYRVFKLQILKSQVTSKEPISADSMKYLNNFFSKDILQLEENINIDVSKWR